MSRALVLSPASVVEAGDVCGKNQRPDAEKGAHGLEWLWWILVALAVLLLLWWAVRALILREIRVTRDQVMKRLERLGAALVVSPLADRLSQEAQRRLSKMNRALASSDISPQDLEAIWSEAGMWLRNVRQR